MQGYTDTPITRIEEDVLKVNDYVQSLSEFILECSTPMTIAIQGDWGSGKTSMMNMIRQNIDSKVVSVWFNTWQYSQFEMSSYLPISLLSHFLEEIGTSDARNALKGLMNGLAAFGKTLLVAATDQVAGGTAADNVRGALSSSTAYLDMAKNLKNLKNNIEESIKFKIPPGKDRVVVFVDDLDRLSPEKAVELLEVLKIFMDVQRTVFILAVDYNVIAQGLKKKFGDEVGYSKGKSFFDKIIQLPFSVPTAQYNISSYIQRLLANLNINEDIERYREIVDHSIGCNPRSLKRIFNSFILLNKVADKKGMFEQDDSTDNAIGQDGAKISDKQRILFAILCLQMAFPELYEFIMKNQNKLEDEFYTGMRSADKLKTEGGLFEEVKRVMSLSDDLHYTKVARFMNTFYGCLQLDDDWESLSDVELSNLQSILSFSAITANKTDEVTQSASEVISDYSKFWSRFLVKISGKSVLFQGRQPNKKSIMRVGAGYGRRVLGAVYYLISVSPEVECRLSYCNYASSDDSKKKITSFLREHFIQAKASIETKWGKTLDWRVKEFEDVSCIQLVSRLPEISVSNVESWEKIIDFLISEVNLIHKTFDHHFYDFPKQFPEIFTEINEMAEKGTLKYYW